MTVAQGDRASGEFTAKVQQIAEDIMRAPIRKIICPITVMALTGVGIGASAPLASAAPPPTPKITDVTVDTDGNVSVAWTPVLRTGDYQIDTGQGTPVTPRVDPMTWAPNTIPAGTCFRVRAVTNDGEASDWSAPKCLAASPQTPPTGSTVSPLGSLDSIIGSVNVDVPQYGTYTFLLDALGCAVKVAADYYLNFSLTKSVIDQYDANACTQFKSDVQTWLENHYKPQQAPAH